MKKFTIIFTAILVFGFISIGCATKPPTEEMNKAQDAVMAAENDADAVTYAGNTLFRAREALSQMKSEANAKRYDTAKNFAAEAIAAAEKAIADGKTGAARAKDEAANLVNGLSGPLAETTNALDTARQVKDLNLNLDSLSGDLDSARQTYDNARQNLAANNYKEAINNGQSVRSTLAGINAKLTEATQATSRKK